MAALFDDALPSEPVPRNQLSLGAPVDNMDFLHQSFTADQLGNNSALRQNAIEGAAGERRKAIEAATGKPFMEAIQPYRSAAYARIARRKGMAPQSGPGGEAVENVPWLDTHMDEAAADALVEDLQAKGQGAGLLRNGALTQRARELALDATIAVEDSAATTSGFTAGLARFVGEAGSAMDDPVVGGISALGLLAPELGLAGTMLLEGALGGVGSAASLPAIDAWRKELGLPEMTGSDMAKQAALDAALAAGTAGLIKGGGMALSRMVTPRQAVDAFDRAFPLRDKAPPDLVARRDTFEVLADLADDNPLGDTPAAEAEHLRRVVEAAQAIDDGKPLPRYAEDDAKPPAAGPQVFDGADPPATPGKAAGLFLFDPSTLGVDAKRFQFKGDGDAQGVNAALKAVKRWEPERANTIMAWQDEAGKIFVVDGHQRTGLAGRLKKEGQDGIAVPGYLFRAKDGFTAEDVMVKAALKNISEGAADPVDAAKVLRLAGPDAVKNLPMGKEFVGQAVDLSRLADEPWRMVINEVVPPNFARHVGRLIPDDAERQLAAMNALARMQPDNAEQAAILTRRVAEAELVKREDGAQVDMFGMGPDSTVAEETRIVARAIAALKKDAALFGRVVRNADAIEGQGSKVARSATQAAADVAERAALTVEKLSFRAGPVRDSLKQLAKDVKDGRTKLAEAGDTFVANLKRAETGPGAERAADGGGPGATADAAGSNADATAAGLDAGAEDLGPDFFSSTTEDPIRLLPDVPDVAKARELFDHVPEPDDAPAQAAAMADLEAQVAARLGTGADLDFAAREASDGAFDSAKALLDDLAADDEFIQSVKVCLE